MTYSSFEKLEVWQRACQLSVSIYEALKECKDYGLKDQMTRAGISIASNIAEGAERNSAKEFVRFLHIAKGSAAELRTQVYIANRVEILSNERQKELVAELKIISKMLHALIKAVDLTPKTQIVNRCSTSK